MHCFQTMKLAFKNFHNVKKVVMSDIWEGVTPGGVGVVGLLLERTKKKYQRSNITQSKVRN